MIGSGIGMTSPSGPRRSRKAALRPSGRITWIADTSALGEAGGGQARLVDGHVPAVDDDHGGVREDAHEGEAEARVLAVRPQAHQEHHVGRCEQRQPQRVHDRDRRRPAGSHDAKRRTIAPSRRPTSAGASRRGSLRLPPARSADDQAEQDAADQHRWVTRPSGRAGPGRIGVAHPSIMPGASSVGQADSTGTASGSFAAGAVAAAVIRPAAWASSGIGRGSTVRPGSATPST